MSKNENSIYLCGLPPQNRESQCKQKKTDPKGGHSTGYLTGTPEEYRGHKTRHVGETITVKKRK